VALLVAGVVGLLAAHADAAGGESPIVVQVGQGVGRSDFDFSPRSLPKGGGPAELDLGIEEVPPAGYLPPGIAEATIRLDKTIGLDFHGVPTCLWGVQIDAAGPNECDEAVVGHAEAKVLVDFPETEPLNLHARGTVYKGGASRLLVKLAFEQPVNGDLVFAVPVRTGRSSSELAIRVPRIASGSGYLTSLDLLLEPTFITAECDRGKLSVSEHLVLGDGSEEGVESIRACRGG
jgi:hypothetical protein